MLGRMDVQGSFPVFLHAFLPPCLEAASPRFTWHYPLLVLGELARDLFVIVPVLIASDCCIDLSVEVDLPRPRLVKLVQKWYMT